MAREKNLYLICEAEGLETAFYCGTAKECTQVLGLKTRDGFYTALSKKQKVMDFFRIEKVKGLTV